MNPATDFLSNDCIPGVAAAPRPLIRSFKAPVLAVCMLPVLHALHEYAGAPLAVTVAAAMAVAVVALLALQLDIAAARRAWRGMTGQIDPSTGLYNPDALNRFANAALRSDRPDSKPVSVVVFDFPDLLEVRHIYGRSVSRKVIAQLAARLQALAGSRGMAARTGKVQFTVVLPGAGRDKAVHAIERHLGKPCRIEFDTAGEEIVLVPDFALEAMQSDGSTLQEIHRELCREILQERMAEQRRQHYLQRERERHSQPMGLRPADGRASRFDIAVPATIPVPLGMR